MSFWKKIIGGQEVSDDDLKKMKEKRQNRQRQKVKKNYPTDIPAHVFTDDMGQKKVVMDGKQIPVVSEKDLVSMASDVLNWFDDKGRLTIGNKNNPNHVKQWKEAWDKFNENQEN